MLNLTRSKYLVNRRREVESNKLNTCASFILPMVNINYKILPKKQFINCYVDKDYHIYPTPSCENLLNIWDIASQCCKIFILPTGSSWTFLHKINIMLSFFKSRKLFCKRVCDICNR